MKNLLLFLLLCIYSYAVTGSELSKPSTATYDFTFGDDTPTVETFSSESVVEKALVEVANMTVLSRRTPNIYSCGFDGYGNEYCPASLAEAAEYWDYESGYSTYGVGTVVDYASKIASTAYVERLSSLICGQAGNGLYYDCGQYAYFSEKRGQGSNYYDRVPNDSLDAICAAKGMRLPFMNETTFNSNPNGVPSFNGWTWTNSWYFDYRRAWNGYSNGINTRGRETLPLRCVTSTRLTEQVATTVYTCPDGYTDNGSNCKKTIEYTYYNYLCYNNANSQGYNYAPTTSGGNCNKTDTDTSSVNSSTLDDACNSSTPPTNNCKRQGFRCNQNVIKPAYVNGQWQCSPYLCEETHKCGFATCPTGTTPSTNLYQDAAYNVLGADYNGTCNGPICDYVANSQITFCTSGACPNNSEYETIDGKCYKRECPAGTYDSNGTCLRQN